MEFVKTSQFIQTEMYLKAINSTKSDNHHDVCDENFDEAHASDGLRIQTSSAAASTSLLSSSSSLAVPDHTILIMPIHQKICQILIDFLIQTNYNYHEQQHHRARIDTGITDVDDSNISQDTDRFHFYSNSISDTSTPTISDADADAAIVKIALIGAGCCAIPAYLLSTQSYHHHYHHYSNPQQQQYYSPLPPHHHHNHPHQQQKLQFSIDAIEPEAQILDIATKYFGINFDNTYLTKHVMDGTSFLKAAISLKESKSSSSVSSSSYDVIVVDAFSNQSSVDDDHTTDSSSHHIIGR